MTSPAARVAGSALLVALVALLLAPAAAPDPFGVGPQMAWPLICASFALGTLAVRAVDRVTRGGRPGGWRPGPVEFLVGLYLAIVLVTWPFAFDRRVTGAWLLMLLAQLAAFFALRSLFADARHRGLALGSIVVGLAWLQVLAVHDHLAAGLSTRPTDYLVPAGWSGRPELGFLAVILAALLTGLWLEARTWHLRLAAGFLWLVALGQLVFLFARMGWIAVVVVLAAAAGFAVRSGRLRVYALVVGLAIAIAAPAAVLHPLTVPLIRSLTGERTVAYSATPGHRIEIWRRTVTMIGDRWAAGTGLGNFQAVYEPNYNPAPNEDSRRGVHAHNTWLQQAGELGVAGGAAHALLWLGVLLAGWRRAGCGDAAARQVTAAAWLALVGAAAYLTGETLTFSLDGPRVRMQTLCWLLAALVLTAAARRAPALQEGRDGERREDEPRQPLPPPGTGRQAESQADQ